MNGTKDPTTPKRTHDEDTSFTCNTPPKKANKTANGSSPPPMSSDPMDLIEDELDSFPVPGEAGVLPKRGAAIVFGASGSQGRAVIEGLVEHNYHPVYGATRDTRSANAVYARDVLGAQMVQVDLADSPAVERVLRDTAAPNIFLVTATDMPRGNGDGGGGATFGFQAAEDKENATISAFFDSVLKVHLADSIDRHVVFSTLDNVRAICEELSLQDGEPWIKPLAGDGSICPHFSGKGRAGEYAIKLLEDVEGVSLTLLTLPFLHSNFFGFATPLPDEGETQWTISACFGENSAIDMLSVTDLAYIVPELFDEKEIYAGKNIRASSERMTMDEVASIFSDLFGKDVVFNPLTPEEMAAMPIPAAGCMAQMCQFLSDPRAAHDVDATAAVMFPRKPQLFKDWLLINSDNRAFEEVGLSVDPKEILTVTVFGATGLQGSSVVKGLLTDARKRYSVRATSRHPDSPEAQAIVNLDPERVELIKADYDSIDSCAAAVDGADGAFLATDFFQGADVDPAVEEQHAKNIIDACEASHSVKHLVFSTMEYVEEVNKRLVPHEGEEWKEEKEEDSSKFDAKARAAAYARTKRLSCTFVLMPCYSEMFYKLLMPQLVVDEGTGEEKVIMTIPTKDDTKVTCMSVDDLGPAVANIFDSYQVYAGHEIGLVTDFVSVKEMSEIVAGAFVSEKTQNGKKREVEKKEVPMEAWLEAKDTYMKDLGQMFKYMSHSSAVKKRHSVAKTMKLLPDTKPFRQWVEHNKDNAMFREKLGLR